MLWQVAPMRPTGHTTHTHVVPQQSQGSYPWRSTHRQARVCTHGEHHRIHSRHQHPLAPATTSHCTISTRSTEPARHRRHHQHTTSTTQVRVTQAHWHAQLAHRGVAGLQATPSVFPRRHRAHPILSHAGRHASRRRVATPTGTAFRSCASCGSERPFSILLRLR